jgi:hypothetical protein
MSTNNNITLKRESHYLSNTTRLQQIEAIKCFLINKINYFYTKEYHYSNIFLKVEKMTKSRRKFLKNSFAFTAGATLTTAMAGTLTSCTTKTIVVGAIGIKNMGYANMRAFLRQNNKDNPNNIYLKALCDIDQRQLDQKSAWVEKQTGKKPDLYTDFRKLLEDKNIDAVIIATPDHWHALISVLAMQAGKHVYVEKPMANSIG